MATMTLRAPIVNADTPSEADRRWWAAQNMDYHATGPTPIDALDDTTDYDTWPEWTQAERWTLSDAEADAMAEDAKAQARMESMGYL